MIGTLLIFYLAFLVVKPFLTAIAWALALAILGMPLHKWIRRFIKQPNVAALLTVSILVIAVIVPLSFVGERLVAEAIDAATLLRTEVESGAFRARLQDDSSLSGAVVWLEKNINLKGAAEQVMAGVGGAASSFVQGSVAAFVQMLIVFFCLFFFIRDSDRFVGTVRDLIPLTGSESTRVIDRVRTTIRATVFGTLAIAAIQGTLGGLMFWWLGLPVPLLWGTIMGLLAIIPVLGAFIVWIPAAIFLVLSGEIVKAVILTVWGAVVIGLIDNILYPMLVGGRIRLHTLPVFFSIVGGLALFGAAGLILGPVVLALAVAVIDVWRHRMTLMEEERPEPATDAA
jgi:predicted PurR-regulated permease PerM